LTDCELTGTGNARTTALAFDSDAFASLYVLPVFQQFVLYAPLHGLTALLNRAAALRLHEYLRQAGGRLDEGLANIAASLRVAGQPAPRPREGKLTPAFLGLLATRGCNLACRYCGFRLTGGLAAAMDPALARVAVNWYMDWVRDTGRPQAEIHFFGGEPFCAPEVLDVSVHLARMRAEDIGCQVRFEVATNGVFGESRARWAADYLDTIVLSMDGPPDIQDRHRCYRDGRGSSGVVARTARILSEGSAGFYIRSCITGDTVTRMPELAAWFCREYSPHGVCFEPMQRPAPYQGIQQLELEPPDPWEFGRNFIRAATILAAHGVEPVYAAADLRKARISFCPVAHDAAIVSPDGVVSACYLLREEWEARGLDLTFGRIALTGALEVDDRALGVIRGLNVWNKPACASCACRWHCAGGCHVNHPPPVAPGCYDGPCIQTRIITLYNLLSALDRRDLLQKLLEDDQALRKAVNQPSDRLADLEGAP
jgi:uncharacterized protein